MTKTTQNENTARCLAPGSKTLLKRIQWQELWRSQVFFSIVRKNNTMSQSTHHENWENKKESVEESQECKATEAATKAAQKVAKTSS